MNDKKSWIFTHCDLVVFSRECVFNVDVFLNEKKGKTRLEVAAE